jgi:hypothetical protein
VHQFFKRKKYLLIINKIFFIIKTCKFKKKTIGKEAAMVDHAFLGFLP